MKRYWPEIVLALAEIPLLYVGIYANVLRLSSASSTLLSAFLIQFTIVIFYLALRLNYSASKNAETLHDIEDNVLSALRSTAEIRILQQNAFYEEFFFAVRSANSAVSMAHLDRARPPLAPHTPSGHYYRELPTLIRNSPSVVFKRVERLSVEKWQWIEHLIQECDGATNFNLSLLNAHSEQPRIPNVSVQLIDDTQVYLVAIAEHENLHEARDMFIRNEQAAAMWKRYYEDSLWSPSINVMREGAAIAANIEHAKALIGV